MKEKGFSLKHLFRSSEKQQAIRQAEQRESILRIIDTLARINFAGSKLPKEVMEHKNDPEQKWCDLEFTCRALQSTLRKSPYFEVNTEAIDAKLLLFAGEFANAVANGNVKAAYAAKNALLTGVEKIRNRIPHIQTELVQGFIDSSVKYLETWVGLIDNSRIVDYLEKDIENLSKHEDKIKEMDAKAQKMEEEFLRKSFSEDEGLRKAFDEEICNQTAAKNYRSWTQEQIKLYEMLRDLRSQSVTRRIDIIRNEIYRMKQFRKYLDIKNALDATLYLIAMEEENLNGVDKASLLCFYEQRLKSAAVREVKVVSCEQLKNWVKPTEFMTIDEIFHAVLGNEDIKEQLRTMEKLQRSTRESNADRTTTTSIHDLFGDEEAEELLWLIEESQLSTREYIAEQIEAMSIYDILCAYFEHEDEEELWRIANKLQRSTRKCIADRTAAMTAHDILCDIFGEDEAEELLRNAETIAGKAPADAASE